MNEKKDKNNLKIYYFPKKKKKSLKRQESQNHGLERTLMII